MRGESSGMQCLCACAVDAARLGLSGLRKVARFHGSKPWHGSFKFDGLYRFEIKYTPTKSHLGTTGACGSAGPAHTTAAAVLLKKMFRLVVAGVVGRATAHVGRATAHDFKSATVSDQMGGCLLGRSENRLSRSSQGGCMAHRRRCRRPDG